MEYLVALFAVVLSADLIRAGYDLRRVSAEFHAEYKKKKKSDVEIVGSGKSFNLVIMGDSTFDLRGDTEMPYGPAQVFVNELAKKYKVHVHLFARAGAKSYDVIARQLPKMKALPKVSLVIVYMGANNAVYFRNPFGVGRDYHELLTYTESHSIPVAASEVANYWQFSLFPLIHRAWMYVAVHIENARLRHAFRGARYASFARLKRFHKEMHRNRRKEPYLLDGFHPNDASNIKFGEFMLRENMTNPAIASLFGKKN